MLFAACWSVTEPPDVQMLTLKEHRLEFGIVDQIVPSAAEPQPK
jgi:hypothetical protein